LTLEELEHLFHEIDQNNRGKISYQEFLMGAVDKKIFYESKKLDELFKLIDDDNCGNI
jgi:Ca2+-binding EF-hand superfamily protein